MKLGKGIYFVTGIDTDAGKSYATAYMAKKFSDSGLGVVTQKFIQTGCDADQVSEDIVTHRRLQGLGLLPEDLDHTTCPIIYKLPSSPHLAAEQQGECVDCAVIERSTEILASRYDVVLVEGAGGVMVPLTRDYLTADYIVDHAMQTIVVSSARLGSLNHTLLTLEYCKSRGIDVVAVVYNLFPKTDITIEKDTARWIVAYLKLNFPNAEFVELPIFDF